MYVYIHMQVYIHVHGMIFSMVWRQVFGFFEELLSTRFPHSSYKLVFVDQAYCDAASYSTLTICK